MMTTDQVATGSHAWALSINHASIPQWSLAELITGCSGADIHGVGLWDAPVLRHGVPAASRMLADNGLRVTSYCRAGFFSSGRELDGRVWGRDDDLAVLDRAAALGAEVVLVLAGGLPVGDRDLVGARERVSAGLEALAAQAAERGLKLGLEPLHPAFCADRSVVCSLSEAVNLIEPLPANVGLIVDSYNTWWDASLGDALHRGQGRIHAVQLSDWVPLSAPIEMCRTVPGEGCIDFKAFLQAVQHAGYRGSLELEIFSTSLSAIPGEEALARLVSAWAGLMLP